MVNLDAAKWLGSAFWNAATPDAMNIKQFTQDDLSQGSKDLLRDYLEHSYDAKRGGSQGFTYDDMREWSGKQSKFADPSQSHFDDLSGVKNTLGQFRAVRGPDGGFTVTDKYNFNKQDEYGQKMNRWMGWSDVAARLNPFETDKRITHTPKGKERSILPWDGDLANSRLYGAVRTLGQMAVPDRPDHPNQIGVKIRLPGRQTVAEPINPAVNPELTNVPDKPIWQRMGEFLVPAAQAGERQEVYRQPDDVFADELQKSGWEGATVLSPQEETAFREWFVQQPFYKEFQEEHGRVPNMDDPDYDYRGLWKSYGDDAFSRNEGDGRFHGFSRAKDGKWLKNPAKHPTAWKEVAMSALNPKFLAERYNIVDDRQLAQAIDAPSSDREAWAKILQQSRDWEANQEATTVAAERSPVSQTYAAQPNYDKLSFGEAFRQAMKNPDTVSKGRFMWRGRPYATQYAKGQ